MSPKVCFFLLLFFSLAALQAQEICDNGQDDDADGLIDLNDPDCNCGGLIPYTPSLAPNPSFEDTLCCPTAFGQLNCTQNWVSGTNTSSDFFHTCDFSAPTQVDVPLPLPSGNAYTGFINNGAYQEFVGTCLPNPLQAGTNYLLNAEVGFGVDIGTAYSGGFSPFSLTLYGATNCADLPVASGTNGCPSLASPDWIVLGSVTLNGSEEWVAGAINFTPAQDINAIILGPDCGTSSPPAYYFLDNVKIGEVPDFGGISLASTGDPCQGTLVLNAPQYANPDLQYQWYRDGVALPGETGLDFLVPAGAGATYQLRIRDGLFCDTAQIVLPLGNALVQATISGGLEICQGEQSTLDAPSGFVSYQWETPSGLVLGAQLNASEAGQYILIATDINACEARDTVDLIVNPVPLVQVDQQDVRCFGERNGQIRLSASAAQAPYQYSLDNGNSISNGMFNGLIAGPYAYLVIDANGCETTGNITLFEPDLLELNLDLLQDAGCDEPNGLIQLSASGGTQQYSIRWADDNSSLFQRADLAEGTYEARLTDANGCEVLESYQIQNDRKPTAVFEIVGIDTAAISLSEAELRFLNLSDNGIKYEWDFGDGSATVPSIEPIHRYEAEGTYLITLVAFNRSGDNCSDTTQQLVRILNDFNLYLPTAFTPNNDGSNDRYQLKGEGISQMDCIIFNRWGQIVGQWSGIDGSWDGTRSGRAVPEGIYTLQIRGTTNRGDAFERAQIITLIR